MLKQVKDSSEPKSRALSLHLTQLLRSLGRPMQRSVAQNAQSTQHPGIDDFARED